MTRHVSHFVEYREFRRLVHTVACSATKKEVRNEIFMKPQYSRSPSTSSVYDDAILKPSTVFTYLTSNYYMLVFTLGH